MQVFKSQSLKTINIQSNINFINEDCSSLSCNTLHASYCILQLQQRRLAGACDTRGETFYQLRQDLFNFQFEICNLQFAILAVRSFINSDKIFSICNFQFAICDTRGEIFYQLRQELFTLLQRRAFHLVTKSINLN